MKSVRLAIALGVAAVGVISSSAMASPIDWVLSGVTFSDGGVASGSFIYDADTSTLSNLSISVSGGSTPGLTPFTYADPTYTYSNGSGVTSIDSDFSRYIRLSAATPFTDAGGVDALQTAGYSSYECSNCGSVRTVTAGSLVGTSAVSAAPEPATWAMMILGLGLVGGMMYRHRRHDVMTRIAFAA